MATFNETLRQLRKENNLTQREIAAKIALLESTYQSYEAGRTEPPIETLIKLADIFECSVDYLLGRANDIGLVAINNDGLSDVEKNLLAMFRKLDRQGQVKLYAIVQAYVS